MQLFFLGAMKYITEEPECMILLLCMRILLLLLLIPLLLLLYLVDFSQKIWYNHGIVGGEQI
jgi:hypothetical protein